MIITKVPDVTVSENGDPHLSLNPLEPGQWRDLTPIELKKLMQILGNC